MAKSHDRDDDNANTLRVGTYNNLITCSYLVIISAGLPFFCYLIG